MQIKERARRIPCSGCERLVLQKIGECRKCRRRRVHMGRKRIRRLERQDANKKPARMKPKKNARWLW